MTVTRLEAVTKTKYKVFIDGQFAFVLYKGELSRFHLEEGEETDPETVKKIRDEVVLKRAKLRSLHLLEDMPRTESQLRGKLKDGLYPPDVIEDAIAYVKSFGYLNDEAYARDFIETRKGKKSRQEIYGLLMQKGLDKKLVSEALEEAYQPGDAREAVRSLMQKRHYDPETADESERQKFLAYLVRKGFSYEDVREIL